MDSAIGNLLVAIEDVKKHTTDDFSIIIVSDHGMATIRNDTVIFVDDCIDLSLVQVSIAPTDRAAPKGQISLASSIDLINYRRNNCCTSGACCALCCIRGGHVRRSLYMEVDLIQDMSTGVNLALRGSCLSGVGSNRNTDYNNLILFLGSRVVTYIVYYPQRFWIYSGLRQTGDMSPQHDSLFEITNARAVPLQQQY